MNFSESCRGKFRELRILTLPAIHVFLSLSYLSENKDTILYNKNVHQKNTRSKNNMFMEHFRGNLREKHPKFQAISYFNKHPVYLKESFDFEKLFKREFKEFLIERELYSVDEL